MDHKKKYEDLIALYSLGLLEGDELKELEAYLETGDEECLKLLENCDTVFSNLPYALEDHPLPPELEDKIMDKLDGLDQTSSPEKKTFLSDFWKGISPAWLSIGSGLATAAIIFLLYTTLTLQQRLSVQESNMESLIASLEKEEEVMDYIKNPRVSVINLEGTMSELGSSGRIFWDTNTSRAILMVSNIPELVPGQTYQFWVMEDGDPHDMGTFTVNEKGESMMEIDCMPEDYQKLGFAVTLEPEGGMPKPTGAKYLVGSL